jgi:hypothetical protein
MPVTDENRAAATGDAEHDHGREQERGILNRRLIAAVLGTAVVGTPIPVD